ncbi:MAG TPA: alpha-amylase family glycosyl hydrolase [Bacteroidales bacterium]|nr:alpha-amylase family glycosyl hydrolase [Bacteroidales bacterium]HQI70482.1 alpha-amylase family glycosyl hydrolase [Bacteroidales bacterium]
MKIHRAFVFSIVLLFLLSAKGLSGQPKSDAGEYSGTYGIATPITLKQDSTVIYLEDFFQNVSEIDSVCAEKYFVLRLSADNKQVVLVNNGTIPALSELKIWMGATSYSVLLKKAEKNEVRVVFDPEGRVYKTVQLAGDVNGWNPAATPMIYADRLWTATLFLNPGTYYYQLVADGKWMLDPANTDSADNNIGGFNSVLKVSNQAWIPRPEIITQSASGNKIIIRKENKVSKLFVFWQNFRLPAQSIHEKGNLVEIKIPEAATALERSFIRVFACNESGSGNDLLVPLHHGKVLTEVSGLTRYDKEAQVMYFMMVDRFYDGDPANNFPVNDPEVLPKANYMGGDIAGLKKKIDEGYFSELGVNMLWVSPLNQNPDKAFREFPEPHRKYSGYHGYWPVSSTKVDYRYGTDTELKQMVSSAHSKEISVILDYVAHHIHSEHSLVKQHPDWFTPLDLPDGRKNIRLWDECRLTTWFDTFLPTFDFSKPEVVECMSDSALGWITNFDLDGFRHDATKHIPESFQRRLTQKIKNQIIIPQNKSFYQIGETYGNRELVGSYVNSGELDGQFDFNLYFDLRSVLLNENESFEKLANSLQESLNQYGCHNLMGNISGNHDMARFISYADGSLSSREDDKEAGWSRNIQVKDTSAYQKLSLLTAYIMTIPGIPVLYYGDEIGIPGAGDPDNRRMMKFDNLTSKEQETKTTATRLVKLRRNNLPLIYGDYKVISITKNTCVFVRTYFGKAVIVVFNKSKQTEKISFKLPSDIANQAFQSNFGHSFIQSENIIEITLPAYKFELLNN